MHLPRSAALSVLNVDVASADPLQLSADTLVIGVFTGGIGGPGTEAVIERLGLASLPLTPRFRGDIGQYLRIASPGLPAASMLFVGLGRMDATDDERLRQAALIAARDGGLSGHAVTTLAQVHPSPEAICAVAEGFCLGAARDRRFAPHAPDEPRLERLTILVPSAALDDGVRAVRRASTVARATITARDLVNTPPNHQPPGELATQLIDLTAPTCTPRLLDAAMLERDGFGGVLGVGRGAANAPCVVEVRYEPDEPLGHVVLCGRGTTFDSGGLTLRSSAAMIQTKGDMAGAAAIAAVCGALGDLDVRIQVTALLALVETLPSGDAQRPDDVVTTRSGTTVEITDPDADAALVVADLIDLARTYDPDAIVDLTTVGPAAARALGRYAGAVMGNDQELIDALLSAAASSGELLWQLPLWDELDRRLLSPVADLRNNAPEAGAAGIVAGLFLRRFAKGVPWAHIDCSGPAFVVDDLATPARPAGGSGYGVRTLLAWLEHRTAHAG